MQGTRFTEMFGLTAPVMSAPMVAHSGGRLAAAVSAGGGLGAFAGMHRQLGPQWIHEQAALVRSVTDEPFAIGFITPFLTPSDPLVAAAIEEQPAAICFSFGDPAPWTAPVRAAGVRVICQVQDHPTAQAAVAAGADVLVAQGTEAGGHTGTMSLLPFLASVVTRHPDVPVLAAGGISDGRTLAAALVAGADGAMLGTVFLATPEAVEVDEAYKRLIVDSDGGDTVLTNAYDIVSGLPWPGFVADRVRRNRFTVEWAGRDEELRIRRQEVAAALPTGEPLDPDVDAVRYGQSAAFVDAIRPAAEVIHELTAGASDILAARLGGG